MLTLRNIAAPTQRAILVVLLLAVVASGVPLIEVHAHEDAGIGHDHEWLAHDHGAPTERDVSADDKGPELPGSSHAHDLSAPAAAPLQVATVEHVEVPQPQIAMPALLRPPDHIATPFQRPPRV